VWRVTDTAQALFDVDDYKAFVFVQIESAVRSIGARYPYDDIEHQETTLRGSRRRQRAAAGASGPARGRRHHDRRMPAHPPRLCAGDRRAMLRRQQAEAVIAARSKLVQGAVGMVEMALQMLSEKGVVELDDERRAAMVSNLMVVLCGERDTQPVVNAGTLYQ
jgi:regulator of protease activity HflC (stomatin/prohibitin superfamily)